MRQLKIDMVSDVVCPWCVIGFKRLEKALQQLQGEIEADIEWHPFELNPQMPPEGEALSEHIARKYGSTPEQSAANRQHITFFGQELGFQFDFSKMSHIYNTFSAHRVLHWARDKGRQKEMELGLFDAYFTEGKDPSDPEVLSTVAEAAGLDGNMARDIATSDQYTQEVRAEQQHFTSLGIQAVPAFIVEDKYLISGAQDSTVFVKALKEIAAG